MLVVCHTAFLMLHQLATKHWKVNSKHGNSLMDASDLEDKLTVLIAAQISGELSRGALLKTLRKDILRMNQTHY